MIVWRIQRGVYDPLDGEGARRVGGRWNSPGRPVVYTAGTQSLAILEALVHLDPDLLPGDFIMYKIFVPNLAPLSVVTAGELPTGWKEPGYEGCRVFGDQWLDTGKSLVLRVPAAPLLDGEEGVYLMNPRHPGMDEVRVEKIEPFSFDVRLV